MNDQLNYLTKQAADLQDQINGLRKACYETYYRKSPVTDEIEDIPTSPYAQRNSFQFTAMQGVELLMNHLGLKLERKAVRPATNLLVPTGAVKVNVKVGGRK